jgi:hypothetical protein
VHFLWPAFISRAPIIFFPISVKLSDIKTGTVSLGSNKNIIDLNALV